MENIALWHERDISHSSAERVIAPDATIVLHFALGRFRGMMEKLVVYPDRMMKNLRSTNGLLFSQRVLLALAAKGFSGRGLRGVQRCRDETLEDREADSQCCCGRTGNLGRAAA
jgi:adenylosuccinate lyase